MDPHACFQKFLNAVADDDSVEAYHAMNDLAGWYAHGGFPAKFPNSDTQVPAKFVYNMTAFLRFACEKLGESVE